MLSFLGFGVGFGEVGVCICLGTAPHSATLGSYCGPDTRTCSSTISVTVCAVVMPLSTKKPSALDSKLYAPNLSQPLELSKRPPHREVSFSNIAFLESVI